MEEPLILEGGGAAPVSAGASLPPLHASQKWQWGMLVLCQLLMAFTFVSTWPLMPFIEFEFFNSNQPCVTANETATDGCQHAMALDSRWTGECSFVSQLAAFLLSPVVGKASDAIGRRPCLLALQLMLWAPWAALWFWSRSGLTLWLYFGLAKASPAISLYMAVAAGYVADVLPPAWRPLGFGAQIGCFGIAQAIGPPVTALVSTSQAIWMVNVFGAAAFLATCFLPESLPLGKRVAFTIPDINPLRQLAVLCRNGTYFRVGLCGFLCTLYTDSMMQTVGLFQRGGLLMSQLQAAVNIAVAGVATALLQTIVVRLLVPRLGEKGMLIAGIVTYIVYLLFYARGLDPVTSPELSGARLIFVLGALAPFGWMFASMLPTLLSKLSSESEQGQVQGALQALRSAAGFIGPVFWGWFYGWLTDKAVKLKRDAGGQRSHSPSHGRGEGSGSGSSDSVGSWGSEGGHSHHGMWAGGPSDVFLVCAVLAAISLIVACTIPASTENESNAKLQENRQRPLLNKSVQ